MHDHRLGSLLGMSLSEVRAMLYPDWLSWKDFYVLEPWGWQNQEYMTAKIMAFLHNVYRKKNSPLATVGEYMRNMVGLIENAIARKQDAKDYSNMTDEEKKDIIRGIVKTWGNG